MVAEIGRRHILLQFARAFVFNPLRMRKIYTTESAAAYLGVTPARVRQLILEERLPSEKYGRDHLITEDSLAKYEKSGKRKAGRPPRNNLRTR